MDLEKTFTINGRDVIAESVDGEVIVINLNSGAYYSSDGVGEEIWRRLVGQANPADILQSLSARCGLDESAIRDEVAGFIQQLVAEELIIETDSATRGEVQDDAAPNAMAYTPPVLNKYTDFEDLLKLDPIHEVHEAAGWPVVKPVE